MKKSYPKVSIVILNWNQKDLTMACLASLKKINYPNYKIIIVDNASEDNSVSAIKKIFPEITIIKNKKNLGVAGGRNVGIRYIQQKGSDYLLLLDNDTIVDRDFLSEMIKVGENNKGSGILTGKIYFYDQQNKIWCAGGSLNLYKGNFALIGYDEVDRGQYNNIKEVDHAPGCCLLIKNKVIEEIGLLDENFIQYFGEDTDWCLRAKKKGYKIIYVPKSKIWHRVIKKTSVSERYWYLKGRNIMLFMRKHAQLRHWILFSLFLIIGFLKILYKEAKAGNLKQFFKMTKGSLDALKVKK